LARDACHNEGRADLHFCEQVMTDTPNTVTLTLVSHTNVGKTTLARTLLRRDIGEVRDAPHVTVENASYELLRLDDGTVFRLWDTPGFGDSARLADRLGQSGNPIGWLLSNVWDRLTNRNFWFSQQILRNVRDEADAVLYLVNATEDPAHVGYIEPEMRILTWVGKPVLVLLNQLGPPRGAALDAADVARWQAAFASMPIVRGVVPFDAFARCWVQEDALLARIGPLLPEATHVVFARLRDAWEKRNKRIFHEAMRVTAKHVVRAAQTQVAIAELGWGASIARIAKRIVRGRSTAASGPEAAAIETMGKTLADDVKQSTDDMLRLHGLDGAATQTILERLATHVDATRPIDANQASVIGGAVVGGLSGLIADIAAGGLTFGSAALSGAVVGAIGARLAARGINRARGTDATTLAWNDLFLIDLTRAAMVRYLAVAHFGRGRGNWAASECPAHWQTLVVRVVGEQEDRLRRAIDVARTDGNADPLDQWLTDRCRLMLRELYPNPHDVTVGLADPLARDASPSTHQSSTPQ
jgi:Domain of unknown function (DUF3482)/50S ribosome-binding GTPase